MKIRSLIFVFPILFLGMVSCTPEEYEDLEKEQIETFSTDPPPSEEPGEEVDPNA